MKHEIKNVLQESSRPYNQVNKERIKTKYRIKEKFMLTNYSSHCININYDRKSHQFKNLNLHFERSVMNEKKGKRSQIRNIQTGGAWNEYSGKDLRNRGGGQSHLFSLSL